MKLWCLIHNKPSSPVTFGRMVPVFGPVLKPSLRPVTRQTSDPRAREQSGCLSHLLDRVPSHRVSPTSTNSVRQLDLLVLDLDALRPSIGSASGWYWPTSDLSLSSFNTPENQTPFQFFYAITSNPVALFICALVLEFWCFYRMSSVPSSSIRVIKIDGWSWYQLNRLFDQGECSNYFVMCCTLAMVGHSLLLQFQTSSLYLLNL